MGVRIINADVMDALRGLPDESVHCVVTSPPYWGLRDYGVEGQIGLEPTIDEFIARLTEVFREVRRVLRSDGTCWVNMGDGYAAGHGGSTTAGNYTPKKSSAPRVSQMMERADVDVGGWGKTDASLRIVRAGMKPKDLIGQPWRLAFALQADGWWLRQDIIWCLSGGAWVYARTAKGDMPVMTKDLVRLDPRTVQLWNGEKWTRVLGWGPSNDDSEKLELVLRSGERIGCTGGHMWPTQRGNVAARDLRIGDVIQSCVLPEPEGCECPPYLTPDALWLVGLFLAEGSWTNGKMQLALSADEAHWMPRIAEVARHYGGTCTHTIDGNMLAVRLYGPILAAIVQAYVGGNVALDKHLKVSAWRLPNDALKCIVSGYLDGDGHSDDGNGRWRLGFCRNYALERDLRTAAARLGATLTLKPILASYQNGDAPAFRGEWRWSRSGHFNEKDRAELVEIRNSRARQFWDIAVEDEPHLFALASGVLTHNCKPNPMPESVRDRCTKAHEYIFMLTKSARYFYDADAIRETAVKTGTDAHLAGGRGERAGTREGLRGRKAGNKSHKYVDQYEAEDNEQHRTKAGLMKVADIEWNSRNKRSVWTMATAPFAEAHFATFPPELPEICIKAGCPAGGTVLDPFGGAGTTGLVADRLQRDAILIELNPEYAAMAERRINGDRGGLLDLMEIGKAPAS